MPSIRQVVTSVFVGIGLVALASMIIQPNAPRARLPNRLFMFRYENRPRYRGESNYVGVAAVATMDPYSFEIKRDLLLPYWSFVTSAASAHKKWLLLYNSEKTTAATAQVDANFNLRIYQTYPFIDFPYQFSVPNGLGYLLMIGYGHEGIPLVGFGQVLDDDGIFVEWWKTPMPDLPFPTDVAGLQNVHVLYSNDRRPGQGSIVHVFDVKHAQVLSTRRFEDGIEGMVVDGELVYFYFSDPLRTTEMCVLDADHQLVTVKRTQFDKDLMFNETFDQVVSTPGAHLSFDNQTLKGNGTIRVLSRDGLKVTAHVRDQDWLWYYYVQC